MTSPAESYWRTAYKYRAEAHRQRAKAADEAADLVGAAPTLPGTHGAKLTEILANLNDPETAAKAAALAQALRAEYDAYRRSLWDTLAPGAGWVEHDAVNQRIWEYEVRTSSIRRLGNHLEAALELDKVARAMTDMGDHYADLGH